MNGHAAIITLLCLAAVLQLQARHAVTSSIMLGIYISSNSLCTSVDLNVGCVPIAEPVTEGVSRR